MTPFARAYGVMRPLGEEPEHDGIFTYAYHGKEPDWVARARQHAMIQNENWEWKHAHPPKLPVEWDTEAVKMMDKEAAWDKPAPAFKAATERVAMALKYLRCTCIKCEEEGVYLVRDKWYCLNHVYPRE